MLPKLLDPRPYLADLRRETQNNSCLFNMTDNLMIVLCAAFSGVKD